MPHPGLKVANDDDGDFNGALSGKYKSFPLLKYRIKIILIVNHFMFRFRREVQESS